MAEEAFVPRLAKLLKMTTSSNDGEAINAMRMANKLLATNGFDWDKLLAGKITIVGDPFGDIEAPPQSRNNGSRRTAPARTPPSTPDWGQPTSPPPNYNAPPPPPQSPGVIQNSFAGDCWCCGLGVPAQGGKVFKPADHGVLRGPRWACICPSCDVPGAKIPMARVVRRAPPRYTGPSANDLS